MLLVQMKIVKIMVRLIIEIFVGNGTYKTKKMGKVHRYYTAKHVKKDLHQIQTLFHYDLRTNEETVFLALKMIP
ncbi:MAG: helix-turn-helix domain-containing protein partial [Methanobrevibacter sp. CfCl-M3]